LIGFQRHGGNFLERRTKMAVGDYGHEEVPGDAAFDIKDVQAIIQKIKDILGGVSDPAPTGIIQKIKDEIAKLEAIIKDILSKI
jgi:hypothetical protein